MSENFLEVGMHECAKKDETKQEDGTNYLFAGRTQSPNWDETTPLLSRLEHTSPSQQQPLHFTITIFVKIL